MKASSNHPAKLEGSQSLLMKFPTTLQTSPEAAFLQEAGILYPSHESNPKLQTYRIVHTIEAPDQRGIQHQQESIMGRRPKLIQHDPSLPELEEYCSYHDCKGHQTIHCWVLRRYLEELNQQGLLKEYILTLEAISRQPDINPPQEQNLIAQYKTID